MDGPWVAEGWSFYSSLRLLVSRQCAHTNNHTKTCAIVVGQCLAYVLITLEPCCACPGRLAWCYGRSVLWQSSHTRGCLMNRSLSLWWREGIWTDQTTVQTDCEYIIDMLPVAIYISADQLDHFQKDQFLLALATFSWCTKEWSFLIFSKSFILARIVYYFLTYSTVELR